MARVRNGDLIELDVPARNLNRLISGEEMSEEGRLDPT
jgi:dihydroxyacid dehydratase/phosphogluconate dehydratase